MAPDATRAIHIAQWECPACHLLCSYPLAAPERIDQYYANEYYGSIWTDPDDVWRQNLVAYRTELGLLDSLIPHSVSSGPALDVGCGYGVLVHMLKQRGYDAVGCETGKPAVAYCRSRGLPVVRATAPDLPFRDRSFQLVVSFHVIEHVLDPAAFVQSLVRVLAPGGAAVVVTDHRWTTQYGFHRLMARLRGRVPPFFTSTDHTFVFAPEHVAALFTAAGCADIKTATFTHVPPGERWHWRAYKGMFRTLDRWRGWGDYMMIVARKPADVSAARAA
jgi:2-polyprenyl-6-hydroxyphenyl methylase/3-demethylubiquinone-9 3-methyltransferase